MVITGTMVRTCRILCCSHFSSRPIICIVYLMAHLLRYLTSLIARHWCTSLISFFLTTSIHSTMPTQMCASIPSLRNIRGTVLLPQNVALNPCICLVAIIPCKHPLSVCSTSSPLVPLPKQTNTHIHIRTHIHFSIQGGSFQWDTIFTIR